MPLIYSCRVTNSGVYQESPWVSGVVYGILDPAVSMSSDLILSNRQLEGFLSFIHRQRSRPLDLTFILFVNQIFGSYSPIILINLASSYYTLWLNGGFFSFSLYVCFNLLSRLEFSFIIPPLPQCCGWEWQLAISTSRSQGKRKDARIPMNCLLHPDPCSGTDTAVHWTVLTVTFNEASS